MVEVWSIGVEYLSSTVFDTRVHLPAISTVLTCNDIRFAPWMWSDDFFRDDCRICSMFMQYEYLIGIRSLSHSKRPPTRLVPTVQLPVQYWWQRLHVDYCELTGVNRPGFLYQTYITQAMEERPQSSIPIMMSSSTSDKQSWTHTSCHS